MKCIQGAYTEHKKKMTHPKQQATAQIETAQIETAQFETAQIETVQIETAHIVQVVRH